MSDTPASSHLDALDDALVRVRRAVQHPAYRRRLLGSLDVDLPLSTLRVMRVVERAGASSPSIGDVAETLAIDPSTASRGVDDGVGRGLLSRSPCASDRRRSRLTLTVAGRDVLDRLAAARRDLLADVTGDWQDAELETLVALLGRLLDGFGRLEHRP